MTPAFIQGAGLITAVGSNVDENWQSVRRTGTGLNEVEESDCIAAIIQEADDRDRLYRLARKSLEECLTSAGWTSPLDARTALVFSHGSPDNVQVVTAAHRYDTKGRCRPDTVYRTMHSYVAARVAGDMNIQGPVYSTSAACAGSSHAINHAQMLLAAGVVDRVLCGGGEILDRYTLAAFVGMRSVLAELKYPVTQSVQPFGAERKGIALGEACGWLALTRKEGQTSNNEKNIAITESSVINVPNATYGDILDPADWARLIGNSADRPCDLVLAHATSTPKGDLAEGKAIIEHFPTAETRSTKYIFGHTLSASSIIDIIMARESMKHDELMVMGHDYSTDPELSALKLSNSVVKKPVNRAIKLSAAFGGAMGKQVLEVV